MTLLVLISHGRFSEELKKSVEMIMGPQENVKAVGLLPSEGPDDFKKKLEDAITPGQETVVMADLMGGTPCNVAAGMIMSKTRDFKLYAGMNMPMVVSFLNAVMIGEEPDVIVDAIAGVVDVNKVIK
jgi:PTS system mannose-specific IIA component